MNTQTETGVVASPTLSERNPPQSKYHSSESLSYVPDSTAAMSSKILIMPSRKATQDLGKTEKLQMTKQRSLGGLASLLSIKKQSLSFRNKKGLSLLERR